MGQVKSHIPFYRSSWANAEVFTEAQAGLGAQAEELLGCLWTQEGCVWEAGEANEMLGHCPLG